MIKLISLDLDGTLMHSDHMTVSDENLKALEEATKRGIVIVVASGRTTSIIPKVLCNPELVKYHIASNGAIIYDVENKKTIHENVIDVETSEKMMAELEKLDLPIEIYSNGTAIMVGKRKDRTYPGLPEKFKEFLFSECEFADTLGEGVKGRSIEKFSVFTIVEEKQAPFKEITSRYGDFEMVRSIADNVDVTAKNADKGYALGVLCEKLGIKREEVMAFGDNDNDIGMLKFADFSVAMGNGSKAAKETAKHMTDTNINSGVAKIINEHIINQL